MILGKNYWCADSPGLHVYKSASLQVCKSASLQVCKSPSLQVCKSASLQSAVCKCRTPVQGFIKDLAPGKLTGCEQDFAIKYLSGCFHLLFLHSFIRKTKNARLKNPTDLLHINLTKPSKTKTLGIKKTPCGLKRRPTCSKTKTHWV